MRTYPLDSVTVVDAGKDDMLEAVTVVATTVVGVTEDAVAVAVAVAVALADDEKSFALTVKGLLTEYTILELVL